MDYTDAMSIDESALDVEWLDQPKRMMTYCRLAAEKKRDADLAKENIDLVKSRLRQYISAEPDKFGLVKITEASLEAGVISHPDYQQAQREFIDAKFEAEVASGAVRAFEQRKTALENLVKLHNSSYFAGPSVPRDLSSEVRKKTESDKNVSRMIGTRRTRT